MSINHATDCHCDTCRARQSLIEQSEITADELDRYSATQLKALLYGLQTGLFDGEIADEEEEESGGEIVSSPWPRD